MRQVLSHILLGLAASSYASAQTMAEADFLIDNGPQPVCYLLTRFYLVFEISASFLRCSDKLIKH